MGQRYGEEFKREAVRLALTSGLPRKQISTDLGVGFSTLNKWVQRSRGPPPAKWSIPIVRRRRTNRGEQTTKTRGNCNQAATS